MTHRERILLALNHREADRVPIDFGGTTATGIFDSVYTRLKQYLGLSLHAPLRYVYPHTAMVRVDPEILDRFDVDLLPIQVKNTNVLHYADQTVPNLDGGYVDEYGVVYRRSPGTSYALVSHTPFTSPDVASISAHTWPDPADPRRVEGLKSATQQLRQSSDRALVIGLPGRFLSFGQNLCGFSEWMTYLASEDKFVNALLDKALEIQAGICQQVLQKVGDNLDIAMFADDLGTQQGLQISPTMYRMLIKPRQKQLFESVKQHTSARVFLHSDGAIASILPDLIEVGVDIVNPVQPTWKGMDTATLKREYGRDITFWGAIDTQQVLPFGSPQDVTDEVKRRIDDLAPGGGFVLAAVHNIQPEVPPENIAVMFDTALDYGRYGHS